ncbi:MAG: formyl transferase [Gammaproteobacteria bacterium]|nr:formyl transferase [Gammaproteobacteria bacterium]
MNIILLGHYDIASLYALDRVIRLMPEHRYSVFLSGELKTPAALDDRLVDLARVDEHLCERFIAGELVGPIRKELALLPELPQPNSEQGLRKVQLLQPDLVVSIRYRRILQPEFIQVAKHGVINLHSGILPDYRGVMATFWAMLAGEPQIGTTLHRIVDAGIDTGPVIEINRRPTRPEFSYLTNVIGLYADGCDAIVRAIRTFSAKEALPGHRQNAVGQYFRTPDSGALTRYERGGLALFDGSEDLEFGSRR